MIKTFLIIIFLLIPLTLWAQLDDLWMMNDMFNEDVEAEITFKTLELYWSTDSYVPFGYQGRALPTKGSSVTVEADLKISGGNPKNLKYSWFLDDIFQEAKSGYGKDDFEFAIRRVEGASHNVLIKIFNESRSFYVEKSIDIPIADPELVIYHKNNSKVNLPYVSSAKSFEIISDMESAFLALPYFFNIKSLKDLEFEWKLGTKSVKESSLKANIFGLKIINKEVGEILEETLKVTATNKLDSAQRILKNIKINIY